MQSDTSPTPTSGMERFYSWLRGLDLRREPGWLGGVAAGLGMRLRIDPLIVRGIIVVVAVLGGGGLMLLLYSAAWLLLPDTQGRIHLERLLKGEIDGPIVAIGVGALLSFLPLWQGFWFLPFGWSAPSWSLGRVIWMLAVIGAIVWLIVWLATRNSPSTERTPLMSTTDSPGAAEQEPTPPSATPPSDPDALAAWQEQQEQWKREHAEWKTRQDELHQQRLQEDHRQRAERAAAQQAAQAEEYRRSAASPVVSLVAIGVALIAGAATWLALSGGDWSYNAMVTGLAVTLGVLGLAVVFNGVIGRRSGGAGGLGIVVAVALAMSSTLGLGTVAFTSGDWQPALADGDNQRRLVIAGRTTMDLADYFDGAGRTEDGHVAITVIAGSVRLTVPADERTTVRTRIVAGSVDYSDSRRSGAVVTANKTYTPRDGTTANRELVVDVWIVAGSANVTQARN